MKTNILKSVKLIVLALIFAAGLQAAYAANGFPAPANPPSNNVDAPINVGTSSQVKKGGLEVGSFIADLNAIFFGKTLFTNDSTATASSIDANSGVISIGSTQRGVKLLSLKSAWGTGPVSEAGVSLSGTGLKFIMTAPVSSTEINKFSFLNQDVGSSTAVPLMDIQKDGKTIVGDVCIRGSSPEKCLSNVGGSSTGTSGGVSVHFGNVAPRDGVWYSSGSDWNLIQINGMYSPGGSGSDNGPASGVVFREASTGAIRAILQVAQQAPVQSLDLKTGQLCDQQGYLCVRMNGVNLEMKVAGGSQGVYVYYTKLD